MAITSRLVNPTSDMVSIEWEPGIYVNVPADGYVDLTHDQLKDFSPGSPGSAAIRNTYLDFNGIFLLDPDISYDFQALTPITTAVKLQEEEYKTRIQNIRNQRTAAGQKPDDDMMVETEKMAGLNILREKIEKLKKRRKLLEKTVKSDSLTKQAKPIDLTRTCLATNPPREFASPTALEMFLQEEENKDLREKHYALVHAIKTKNATANQ